MFVVVSCVLCKSTVPILGSGKHDCFGVCTSLCECESVWGR